VLVVGGTNSPWGVAPPDTLGDPVDQPEIYDPETGKFTTVAATAVAAGPQPVTAWASGWGAFVLSGIQANAAGGDVYGVIATGPR
jgi:hypothetical protein